jgi:hypothetical protein
MVTVRDIKKTLTEDKTVLSAKIDCETLGFAGFEVWYQFPEQLYPEITLSGNPFVPALVIPAMYAGENLRIEAAVSEKLLNGAAKVIQIYRMWHNAFKQIEIETQGTTKISLPGPNIAAFFTCGVDSFYTLLKNKNSSLPDSEKISHLIYVNGFDISLEKTELFRSVLTRLEKVSDAYNKKLLVVSTNVRRLIENICVWNMYHGSAMLSVALCLENFAGKIYAAADRTYRHTMPHGLHPLTNPLWSSESLEVVYDGAEVNRIEKIKLQIANDPVALNNLRVCFENPDGKYNCGECEKCIRTKLNLKAAGVLEKCSTLDKNIDYKKIKNLKMDRCSRTYMLDNYDALRQAGADKKLLKAVKYCLSPRSATERKRKIREIKKAVRKKIRKLLHINKPERKKIICDWSV